MKTFTGKTKTGACFKGMSSMSGMPNHKPKRVRKPATVEENETKIMIDFNLIGLAGMLIVGAYAPLPIEWKMGIMAFMFFSACHTKEE